MAYCNHMECRTTVLRNLEWIMRALPHRSVEIRAAIGKAHASAVLPCHRAEGAPAPLPREESAG